MDTAMSRGPMPQPLAKPYLDKAQNDGKSILGLSEYVEGVQKISPPPNTYSLKNATYRDYSYQD